MREDDVAGRLVGAGKHRAEHHGVGACGDRLRHVARRGDAAVGDHRHAVARRGLCDVVDRRDLRHADPRDDAGRADRARPDPDLDRVGAGVDQRLGRVGGRDVAGDHLELAGDARDARAPSRSRRASGRGRCRRRARRPRRRPAPARARARRRRRRRRRRRAAGPAGSLVASGNSTRFEMSLTVIRPLQPAVGVDDRQLLDAVAVQELLGLGERRPDRRGDEVRATSSAPTPAGAWLRSKRRSRLVRIPTRRPSAVGDRNAGDVVALHQRERVGDERVRRAASPARRSSRPRSASPCRPRPPGRRSRGCAGRCRGRPRARARSPSAPR